MSLSCSIDPLEPPRLYARPGEVLIELTKGWSTIINIEDEELVKPYSWRAQLDDYTAYAATEFRDGSRRRKLFMHRLITTAPKGTVVDHWDNCGVNNRRKNLKVMGYNDNAQKAWAKIRKSTAGFRGVTALPNGKFRARLSYKMEDMELGRFDTAEEAARAYDAKIRELYGPYGWTNFDNPVIQPAPPEYYDVPF